jgi:hypothetical protein
MDYSAFLLQTKFTEPENKSMQSLFKEKNKRISI